MSKTREFDLNIEKVLENWETKHAIREIIANAFDEQLITGSKPVKIFKDEDIWHVRDYGRGLRYQHFTQNENEEKLNTPGIIGKFGIGLKDALATFDRRGLKIEIESRHGVFTIKHTQKAGFSDIMTLHAEIKPPRDENFIGTDFKICGCIDEDIEGAKEYFLTFSKNKLLEKTEYGEIYEKSGDLAGIYINGIKVAEEPNFLFSYNITSLTKAIRNAVNRERANVGRSAYTDRVKDMLLKSESKDVCRRLLDELKRATTGDQKDESKWTDVQLRFIELLDKTSNVVFMTTSEMQGMSGRCKEIVENSGKEVVFIPDNIMVKAISSEKHITTTANVIEEYNNSFKYEFVEPKDFTDTERNSFSVSQQIIDLVYPGFNIRNLKVSETLRIDESNTRGICEGNGERIIILREVLSSKTEYCGVLAHELVHASSGYSDCCRGFENALTDLIGRIIAQLAINPHRQVLLLERR